MKEFMTFGLPIKPGRMACLNVPIDDDEEYRKTIQHFMNNANYVCLFAHLDDKIVLQASAMILTDVYPNKKIESRINNLLEPGNMYLMNMERDILSGFSKVKKPC